MAELLVALVLDVETLVILLGPLLVREDLFFGVAHLVERAPQFCL